MRPTSRAAFSIAPQTWRQVLQVGARADVHVQAGDRQAVTVGAIAGSRRAASCQMPCFDCSPPVLVFWLWPWPKPGLIRSVIVAARRSLAELVDHVGRAAVDVNAVLDDQVERLAVEDVGRVDDRRRIALRRVAGGQARRISPALTASTSTPCRRTRSRIARFEHAFWA